MIDREWVRLEDVRSVELLEYSVRACVNGWVEDV
jgi:hypothetical protein